jgi:hypothetical protein
VGEREFEFGLEELLDVGTANIICLLQLDNAENLPKGQLIAIAKPNSRTRTWIDRKRARWRAAISW